jgi:hypothetical protein
MVLVVVTQKAFSQENFVVTIEPPGVANQESPLVVNGTAYGAEGVHQETFDRFGQTSPTIQNKIFFANDSSLGSYSPSVTRSADQFGGAHETPYMTVNPSIVASTLTLDQQERYFGLWWSAGDTHNELEFFKGGHLLFRFLTADVLAFIRSHHLEAQYFGNPNPRFRGQNNHEPYAFLNFFADPLNPNVTFDKIILTNNASTGFESDNHTIAAAYKSLTGEEVPPASPEEFPIDIEEDEEISVGEGGVLTPPV